MCGIFGITGHPEASNLTYLGLHALQHRGQESAGIVAADGDHLRSFRAMGLVADIFNAPTLEKLPGGAAIGHVRYSTAGVSQLKNAQPLSVEYAGGQLAVAHNGNLVNAPELRKALEADGAIFQSDSDTEVIIHFIARSKQPTFEKKVVEALGKVKGAYSLLFLTQDQLVAVRDPYGFRPLVLGRLRNSYVLASETTALDLIEAEYIRELEPGEMVVIDAAGVRYLRPFADEVTDPRLCLMEFVYFARPDGRLYSQSVHMARQRMGEMLAEQAPVEADMVVPVPESGVPAAQGFARASGIPYGDGFVKNRYIGRSFIAQSPEMRRNAVRLKLNPLPENVAGKRLVVVDDSIVRGTTQSEAVRMLREAGAAEVHLRIMSPPYRWPCFYGIDTGDRSELLGADLEVDEIRKYLDADSLAYLTLDRLVHATGAVGAGFCAACFNNDYPVEVPVTLRKDVLERNDMPPSGLDRLAHEPI
jgi:amidophosphoribosyltransferase